jgi:hypothetical protein
MKIFYAATVFSMFLVTNSIAAGSADQIGVTVAKAIPEGAGHVDKAWTLPERNGHIDIADLSEEQIIAGRAASVYGCPRLS